MQNFLITLTVITCLITPVFAQDSVRTDTVKSAQGITIETAVDKSDIYIGDLINYRLTIIHDSDIILTPPPIGANLGAFDVKDYQADDETSLDDGRIKIESRFLLTTFTTGDYIIPPIPIQYITHDSTVKILISEPVSIRVNSLLAEDSDTLDIRNLKKQYEFKKSNTRLYYLIAAGLLVIAIVAYIIWRRRRRNHHLEEFIDPRQPWEIAFEDLAYLKEKNYPTSGKFKQYYVELTEIIRAYLGRMYKIPVLDMTTEEFCAELARLEISDEIYDNLKRFLNHADLVKFARLIPEIDRIDADFNEAYNIIESHRQILIATQPEEAVVETVGGGDV